MPQHTSYASMANSGKHSKRIAYFKSMGSTATATATATSPCGSSYPYGPYVFNYGGDCSGFSVYYNKTDLNQACCVSTSGQKIPCPSCVYMQR